MNSCIFCGRLTKDPEVKYTDSQLAVATFTLAIDRPPKDGKKETDFPQITVFGKLAENCEKYLAKGKRAIVQGRCQTGSYTNKNGDKVYTTNFVADRVEFVDFAARSDGGKNSSTAQQEPSRNQREDFFDDIDDIF